MTREELEEIKQNRAKQKVGPAPLESRLIAALEQAWAERQHLDVHWRSAEARAERAEAEVKHWTEEVAYQRRHRKWALKKGRTHYHLWDVWAKRAEQAAARLKRCEEQISAAMQKCRQYWNESDIGDAEIHAVLEWVHDCLLAALRGEEEKE